MAVVALGSTGCSMLCSSSASAEILELDLNLLGLVFCVSALCNELATREDMLPLFRAEACCIASANVIPLVEEQEIDLLASADVTSLR